MLSLRYLAAGLVMTEELLQYVTVWATQLAYFQPNMVFTSGHKNTFDDSLAFFFKCKSRWDFDDVTL